MIQNALEVPIGSTVATQRVEIRFFINGNQHILQFGPRTAGEYQQTDQRNLQGRWNGSRITRDSDTTWTISSSDESLGRLWDDTDPSHLLIAASTDSHIICSFGESDPPMTAR